MLINVHSLHRQGAAGSMIVNLPGAMSQTEEAFLGDLAASVGSVAYEPFDKATKEMFAAHFDRIYSDSCSGTLVKFDGARGGDRQWESLDARARHLAALASPHSSPKITT